jgi:hypothetical protein
MAARAGHTEVAKYLLQNKAKVNAKAKVSSRDRKGMILGHKQFKWDGGLILIRGQAIMLCGSQPLALTS